MRRQLAIRTTSVTIKDPLLHSLDDFHLYLYHGSHLCKNIQWDTGYTVITFAEQDLFFTILTHWGIGNSILNATQIEEQDHYLPFCHSVFLRKQTHLAMDLIGWTWLIWMFWIVFFYFPYIIALTIVSTWSSGNSFNQKVDYLCWMPSIHMYTFSRHEKIAGNIGRNYVQRIWWSILNQFFAS